jgi:hypothetical protein
MEQKTFSRSHQQRLRWKSIGLCPRCGKRPPTNNYTTCEICRTHVRNYIKDRGKNDPTWEEARKGRRKNWWYKIRTEIFEAYGGPICNCCGETEIEFLQLDHIDNNGGNHRKSYGNNKYKLYADIRKEGYPPKYQILCANCNSAKAKFGVCVHKVPLEQRKELKQEWLLTTRKQQASKLVDGNGTNDTSEDLGNQDSRDTKVIQP